jgi:hypothetical protein
VKSPDPAFYRVLNFFERAICSVFIESVNLGESVCTAAFKPNCSGVKAEKRNWALIDATYN